MSLTLKIENLDRLENGEPLSLKLDRHGAVIGRSPHSDWSLPDPKNYVSSTHCEIDYRDGIYVLIDKSTNGTSINSEPQRLSAPHQIQDGDVIVIGHYRIRATTKGGASTPSASPPPAAAAAKGGWGGWDDLPGSGDSGPAKPSTGWDEPAPQPQASSDWGAAPAQPSAGWGASSAPAQSTGQPSPAPPPSSNWGAEPTPAASSDWGSSSTPAPSASAWGSEPASSGGEAGAWGAVNPAASPKSGWDPLATPNAPETPADAWASAPGSAVSGRGPMAQNWSAPRAESPAAQPAAPVAAAADDPWGKFTSSNSVDWARAGLGETAASPSAHAPLPPSVAPTPRDGPASYSAPPADDGVWAAFLAASGVPADLLKGSPSEAAAAAGGVMKRLVAGLVVMLEARARAKAQLGAQSTTLELAGNNPLKFARNPERVLAQLLNPPERGFMESGRAIEDSFQDLQAHQMATLAAMQGALRSTLDRFSPDAINSRAETRGLLAKILPSARNAALWEAYVKEFDGVARGSEEAFLDIFSKAFKAAYEKAAADMKRAGR